MNDNKLIKSLLWTLVGAAIYISNKPPQKASHKDKLPKTDRHRSIAQYTVPFNMGSAVFMSIAEILTVQSSSFRRMTSYPSSCDAAAVGTPFLFYSTIIMMFFLIRLSSYRTLGDLFTFNVTIRPNHRLVTDGPYQFVRHPSYTGIFGVWIGNTLLHFSECDSLFVRCFSWVWLMVISVCIFNLGSRSKDEDQLLHETFGAEWESYRSRVPYRFIPGIM